MQINGPALKAIREAQGYSQAGLARDLEITPTHLCLVEQGKRPASRPLISRIANKLHVPLAAVIVPNSDTAA